MHAASRGFTLTIALYAATAATAAGPGPATATAAPQHYDPARHSRTSTECDRRAAHGDDPHRVAPGLERVQMDLPAAIDACRADLAKDADNPRLQYQLGRALTYAGRVQEALPSLERAAAAGYPQALFVLGYLYLTGLYDAPHDACRAGELIRASALAGRLAGQVGFPKYALDGRFAGCTVPQDRDEMIRFLETAVASKPDYYPALLADELLRRLKPVAPAR